MSDVHKRIQAVCKEYETSLEDLTFNSRVLIQSLTLLADKSKVYAPYIVQIVEKRITKVHPDQKLPILYLLDSIMKNLGGEYLQLFSKNIVATFCHTFEKVVDPKKRQSLFKLRQTWNAIIPVRKLVAIDKHVHSIDNAWPITAESPPAPQSPTIFVNPKFVKPDGELATQTVDDSKKETSLSNAEESKQGSTILEQRKALLEQQKQKRFETEKQLGLHKNVSSETSLKPAISRGPNSKRNGTPKHVRFSDDDQVGPVAKKIKQDEDTLSVPSGSQEMTKCSTSSIHIRPSMLNLDDLPEELISVHQEKIKQQVDRELSTGRINRDEHSELVEDIDKYYELQKQKLGVVDKISPPAESNNLPAERTVDQTSQPMDIQQSGSQGVNSSLVTNSDTSSSEKVVEESTQTSSILEQVNRPVNVSDLLSKLVQTGLLPQQQQQQQLEQQPPVAKDPKGVAKPVNSVDEHLPPAIRLNPNLQIPDLHLKISHLKQFYPSLVELLYAGEQCSQCGLRFAVVPSKEYSDHLDWHFQLNRRDKDGLRKTSRNWFLHPDDWYNLKEGEQIEDKVKSSVFEQEQLEDVQRVDEGNNSCKVLPGEGNEACHLCGETFEQFWEEDLEEWHFKDAVRTSEGSLYHTDCQKEAKDSEVPVTPVTPIPMETEINR